MDKMYLTDEIFLQKLDNWIVFVDGDDSEPVRREDIPYLSKGFGISKEVLEDFFDN
jgi:hypothetical protein